MNKNLRFIFEIITSVVSENGVVPVEPDGVDWNYIYAVSSKHNIINLIGYSVKKYGFSVPEDLKKIFIQRVYQLALINESQLNHTYSVFDAFEKNGIDYMSLKGVDIKEIYPSGDMRVMGDADILVRFSDIDRIKPIMDELGFSYCGESNHEIIYKKEPYTKIELHKYMVPTYNDDLYSYYGDGWKLAKPKNSGSHRYTLSAEDNYIYLLTHFAKHYRDAGAGIKYLIDLWLYKQKFDNLDVEYVENQLQNLRLFDFYKNIEKLTACWFENGVSDKTVENMTQFIVESGVHGSKEHRVLAETVREYMDKDMKKAEKYRYVRMVFPSLQRMTAMYPILNKVPFLLPFCWVIRLVNGLTFKRKNITSSIERAGNIENDALENYKEHMEAVGLDIYNGRK